ncbi:unnamed protein product, partial [Ectocarpus sp. 8 AP-2014]
MGRRPFFRTLSSTFSSNKATLSNEDNNEGSSKQQPSKRPSSVGGGEEVGVIRRASFMARPRHKQQQ